MTAKKRLLGVNFPIEHIPDIERRKTELGFKTLSDYLKDLISRDLAAPPEPIPSAPPALRSPSPEAAPTPVLDPKHPWRDPAILALWFMGLFPIVRLSFPVDLPGVTRKYVDLPRGVRPTALHHRLAFRFALTEAYLRLRKWATETATFIRKELTK